MAEWVIAVLKYSEVNEKALPLKEELNKFDMKLSKSKQKLKENEVELSKLEGKVEELKQNFAAKTSAAEALRADLKREEEILKVASELLLKLGDEKVRWEG